MKYNRKMVSLSIVAGVLSILCFSSMGMCTEKVRAPKEAEGNVVDSKEKAPVIESKGTVSQGTSDSNDIQPDQEESNGYGSIFTGLNEEQQTVLNQ